MSHTIRQLPAELIAQIAAGEVIDRPASIVKELIENATDAGATEITIELHDGGKELIRVTDNGYGMSAKNLGLAWQAHTTSKIASFEELSAIGSFGFRGEALHSILHSADVTLRSRTPAAPRGHELQFHHAQPSTAKPVPIGMAVGTEVTVEHLFLEVPARRAFLSTPAKELQRVIDVVTHHGVAQPDLGLTLINNGQRVLSWPKERGWHDRLPRILGQDAAAHLLPLEFEGTVAVRTQSNTPIQTAPFRILGLIGAPQLARRNRVFQFLSINGRPVEATPISAPLLAAYGSLLEARMHPTAVISLTLPANLVDPNVHPQKQVVRLQPETELWTYLIQAVQQTLAAHNLTYTPGDRRAWRVEESSPHSALGQHLKENTAWQTWDPRRDGIASDAPILQVHRTYLIVNTDDGLLMLDQHAAHERVLYELFKRTWLNEQQSKALQMKELSPPALIDVSIYESQWLETAHSWLATLGIAIEPFRDSTYAITAVPSILADREPAAVLRQVLDDWHESELLGENLIEQKPSVATNATGLPHPHLHRLIAYLACRTAIKAGDTLTVHERQRVVQDWLKVLKESGEAYTCPHGRPVMVHLTQSELEKMFKR